MRRDATMQYDRPVVDSQVAYRTIGGEARVISVLDSRLHHLDPVATFVWEQIDGGHKTVQQIVAAMVDAYEVEPEVARVDLEDLLGELTSLGLIRWERAPDVAAAPPEPSPDSLR